MATVTVQIPESVKTLAEERAAKAGCRDLGAFFAQLVLDEAASPSDGTAIDSDKQLEALVQSRIDGPFIEMDATALREMRERITARLDHGDDDD